jgi:hypothetical protein
MTVSRQNKKLLFVIFISRLFQIVVAPRRIHGHVTEHFPFCDDAAPRKILRRETMTTNKNILESSGHGGATRPAVIAEHARHQTDDKHHLFLAG